MSGPWGSSDTWTCHICGRERPDDKVSVTSHTELFGPIEARVNVRHCNDRPECIAAAPTHSFQRAKDPES